jgi:hypothetical protein
MTATQDGAVEATFLTRDELRKLADAANPYYCVERRPDGALVYPTERLYEEHLASNPAGTLFVCVVAGSGVILTALANPTAANLALLGIGAGITLVLLAIQAYFNGVRRGRCQLPLRVGRDGALHYRDRVIAMPGDIDHVEVHRAEFDESSTYTVRVVTRAGKAVPLPGPFFGDFEEPGPASLLARDLALLLDRPLRGEVVVG